MLMARRALGLAVALLFLATFSAHTQGGPAGVGVAAVELREMSETVPVFAEVVAERDGIVAARVAGTVDQVHVLEGMTIGAGAPLVTLDTELTQIELRQAEARLSEAEAGITVAEARMNRLESALERVEALRGTASFSEGRFDDAQGEVFEARGQLAEAEARLLNAEAAIAEVRYRIEQAEILAPFSGTVLTVETNPGEFIASGAAVVRLLDTRTLEVEAQVPSRFIGALAEGQEVAATGDDGAVLMLKVRALLPTEEITTRTRPARFAAAENGALKNAAVGQALTVDIPTTQARQVLAVPKDALVQARGGWTVFIDEDGTAQPRPVEIGAASGNWFEVLSGLGEGDIVVTRGNERLRPGQPIAAMPEPASTSATSN
ncbi:MAG: efflux RND transporter periplasmic adaptor subunit [Pseudomonadota bacterium]